MTAARERTQTLINVEAGVYAPQEDSFLLSDEISSRSAMAGARVLDLCTGSGIAAIEAARMGARDVVAYDISADAVSCASANAVANGVQVDVRLGTIADALRQARFDFVVSNPPYVPSPEPPVGAGVHRAWDAGDCGRVVLDPLCTRAAELLAPEGVLLVVQSEFSGIDDSLRQLRRSGLVSDVIRTTTIDFGPVMRDRASWMEETGRIAPGCRREELVLIEARRRATR